MGKTQLQILQTSDIHGYIYPFSYTSKQEERTGLAKLSTLINTLRTNNTLLIDSGDTIQGSPFTYYHSKEEFTTINPMANIFNYMNYDYVTIGNHDFNYGKNYLSQYLDYLNATILNCNLLDDSTKAPFKGISYEIKTVDNITIGIIGVTTHYITNWEQPKNIEGISIEDAFLSTKKTVELIRNQVDFLIVNYHGGFERDLKTNELITMDTSENQGSKMLNEINGIDLLLTGHQHRSLGGVANHVVYTQPGFNASSLSQVVIEFNDDKTYKIIKNNVLTINDEKADDNVLAIAKGVEERTQSYLDTPVGKMDDDLLINNQLEARINKHPLVSLINHIQLEYTGADISLCGLGNSVSGFKKDITIRDVIGTYIYPNTLVVKKMSGYVLKESLEKTAEFFDIKDNNITISDEFRIPKVQLYAYDMYDGIEYTIKVSNPKKERILNLTIDGEPLDMNREYTVVMNNYRASGGGDYFFIKDCETVLDTQKEVIELLLDYILKERNITIPHKENIKVIK